MGWWSALFGRRAPANAARPAASPRTTSTPESEPVPEALQAFRRTAFVPVVEEGDGARTDSKFSGAPWFSPGERWPACGNCHRPLQLFVQLNLATLPAEARGASSEGLVQLFYCTSSEPHCESDCEAWGPFATSVVARLVQPTGEAGAIGRGDTAQMFPPKRIVGWSAHDDYPSSDEIPDDGELDDVAVDAHAPRDGDKLGGWPAWVQGIDYPQCPRCKAEMRLLFQIDSEDHLPYMFGDAGRGHLTQCPQHPDVLAFGWACG